MVKNNLNIKEDMMRGFEPLESICSKLNLSSIQKINLKTTQSLMSALKYTYAPLKGLFNEGVDLKEGLTNRIRPKMKIRGFRTLEVDGEYYLSKSEVKEFRNNGISGPFKLFSEKEAHYFKKYVDDLNRSDFDNQIVFGNEKVKKMLLKNDAWNINYSGIYQALRYKKLWDALASKKITQRLASLLGDDIICWRSQFFEKEPKTKGTFWHQTGTFRENSNKPKLKATTDINESLIQLTVWVALTDTTIKNGCMRIIPGSYRDNRYERLTYNLKDKAMDYLLTMNAKEIEKALRTIKFTSGNFTKAQLAYEIALREIPELFSGYKTKDLQLKAGEFVIFTSLNTHGSYPNVTDADTRLAFAGRYTTNDVKVLDGFKKDYFAGPGKDIPISVDPLRCIQVLGDDKFGYNNMAVYPE